jgi:uncharacterized membrane protein YeaQ/YmgE (transglycosylase-associated protein family)
MPSKPQRLRRIVAPKIKTAALPDRIPLTGHQGRRGTYCTPGSLYGELINRLESSMGIIVWLVVGGVVGWLASIIMRTDGQQGLLLNVVVGIVGALLAGFVVSPLLGIGTINQGISIATFLVSLLGAVILLAIVNLFRRGAVR